MFEKLKSFKVKIVAAMLAVVIIVGAGPMDIIGNTMARVSSDSSGSVLPLNTNDILKTIERVAGAQAVEELQNAHEANEETQGSLSADLATAQIIVEPSEEVVPKDKDNNQVVLLETLPQIGEASYYVDQEMEQFIAGLDIPEDSKLMEQSILENLQNLWFIKSYSGNGYQAVAMLNPNTFEVQLSFINNSDAQKNFTLEVVDAEGNPLEVIEVSAMIKKAVKQNLTPEELSKYQAQDNTSVEILSAVAENKAAAEEQPEQPVVEQPEQPETTDEKPKPTDEDVQLGLSEETPVVEEPKETATVGELVAVEAVVVEEQNGSANAMNYSVPSRAVFTGLFGGITPFGLNHSVEFFIDNQPYGEKVRVASGKTITEEPAPPHQLWPNNTTAFNGWFLDGATVKFNFANPVMENLRLYARFSNVFNVAYKNSVGTILETKQVSPNAAIPEPSNDVITNLSPPEGTRLVYWYDETGSDKTPFVFGTAATKDISLKPYFSNEFYVIFMSEGTQVNPQAVVDGDQAVAPTGSDITSRDGFTFKYWATVANGGADKKYDFNTPVKDNLILYAVWEAKTVDYTIIYWVEKANFDGDPGTTRANYSSEYSVSKQGTAGTAITIDEATADSYIASTIVDHQSPLRYSKFRHGDKNVTLVGNGSTTINVYYKRVQHTYNFYVKKNIGTEQLPSLITYIHEKTEEPVKMDTNKPSHTIKAKFQQDVTNYWPTIKKSSVVSANQRPNGWQADNVVSAGSAWVSSRYLITAGMINQNDPKNENDYECALTDRWLTSTDNRYAEYWLETLDGSGTLPTGRAASIAAIKTHDFTQKIGYNQTLPYELNSTLNPKDIDGFEENKNWYDGSDGSGVTKKFYYLRRKANLVFDAKGGRIDIGGGGSPVAIHTIKDVFFDMPLAGYKPADPTLEGHTFAGWYRHDDYNEAFDLATEKMPKAGKEGELRLFAKWEATEFTVTYHNRLGDSTVLEQHGYGKNQYVQHPATLYGKGDTVAGYGKFEGWFWIVPGTNIFTEFSVDIPVGRNIDLYATWKTSGFSVAYEAGRGTGTPPVDQDVYDIGRSVALKSATGITPPSGEVFYGWSPEGAVGELYYPRNLYGIQGDTTFVAQFGARDNAYQLTFDPGYDGSTESAIAWYVPKNGSVYLLDKVFTHPNATLMGWSETKGATTVQYNLEQLVQIQSNKTLYAVWNIRNYNIYFQTDPVKGTLQDTAVDINGTVKYADIPYGTTWSAAITRGVPKVVAKAGYLFTGWSPTIPADSSIINSDKTYIAQYEQQTAITIKANDGSKTYDGTPLTVKTATAQGLNASLYRTEVTMTTGSTITNVGEINNTIQSYKIIEIATGKDVTYQFAVTIKTGKLKINPAVVSVAADNKTITYGTTIPIFTATVTGRPSAGATVNYTVDCSYGAGNVGTYDIIVALGSNPNYTVSKTDGEFIINKNTTGMTVAAAEAEKTVTYNGLEHKIDVKVTGPTTGYTIKYSLSETGAFTETHPSRITVADSATIYFEVSHPNYNTVTGSGKLKINPATVSVAADNKTITYGTTIPIFTATVTGKPTDGDIVNYSVSCNYAPGNVGAYDIIVALGSNPNYTVSKTDGEFIINKNTTGMTAVAAEAEKTVTYNGLEHKINVVVKDKSGPLTGYTIKYALSETGPFTETHPIRINVADSGTIYFEVSHPNYDNVKGSGKLKINPATVSVAADNKTITYGTTIPIFTATVTGRPSAGATVNYTVDCSYGAGNVGTYDIIVALGSNPNYTVSKTDGEFIINKNTTGMTAAAAEAEKTVTYNGLEHKIDVKVTGPTTGYTIKYSLNSAGPFTETHPSRINVADSATIHFEVSHPNYNPAKGSGKLKINPATVSIVAKNETITYGAAIPTFTATVTGRPAAGATVEYTVDCNYGTGNVGTYDIIVKLGTNPNYTATKTDGEFIINKNTTGMTAAAAEAEKTVTYNGLEHKIDVKVTGPTTGYTIKYSLNSAGPFTETHPSRINVADSATIHFEVSHPNYNPAKGSGKLKINPATVSIVAKNETITYGAAIPTFTATVTGRPAAGATVEYTVDCNYGTGNVGTYDIIVKLGTNPNYTATKTDGKFIINKNATGMTAAAAEAEKTVTYNGLGHKIDVKVTGPTTGYTVKYSLNAAGPFSETHPSRITVADSTTIHFEVSHPNYNTVTGSGKLKINPAVVSVAAKNETITYGAAIPTFTATVTGRPAAGATVEYTVDCNYGAGNVGTYDIIVKLGTNPNYTVSKTDGKFIINKNTTGMAAAAAEAEKTVTYNGLEHKIDVKVTGPTTGYTIKYSLNAAGPFSETHPSRINVADSGTIYFEVSHPNYNTAKGSGKLKINPATVSIVAKNETITYGAAIPTFTATVTGRPGAGDTVVFTVDCSYGAGDVGTYDIIVKLGTNPNYTVSKTDGEFTINKNTTGMTAAAAEAEKTVTYNGLEHKIDVKVTGPTTGYTIKYSLNAAGPFSETHPSRINVADSTTIYFEVSHPNYNPAKGSGKLKINPATVSVAADNKTITYGAAIPAFTATVTGRPGAGDTVVFTVDCSYGAGDVGTYDIIVKLGTNPNYTATKTDGKFIINKNTTGMTAAAAEAEKTVTYNGLEHKIDVKVTGPTTGYTIKYSLNAAGPFSETHPSRINVADSGTIYFEVSHPNYNPAKGSGKLKINPATVSVVAKNETITYGAAIPTFTATVTGRPAAGATVEYTVDCNYGAGNVGAYDIIVALGTNPNYTASKTDGKFIINKNTTGMTAAAAEAEKTVTYNGLEHKIDVKVTGPTTGYTIKYSLNAAGPFSETHPSRINVADSATIHFEVSHPNYNPAKGSGKLKINPATVSIVAKNETITYGAAIPTFTATVTGRPAAGATVEYTVDCNYGTGNVGTYDIIVKLGTNPNYTATKTDGKFIINKNTTGMTAAAAEAEKIVTYNGSAHKIDVNVVGPTTGYTIKYSLSETGPFSETHPSRINVADSGTIYFEVSHPNYNPAKGSGKLKINPATVSIAAKNETITYGAASPAFTATVTGRPAAGAIVEYTVDCNYGTGNVGTYDIIVKLGTNPNYTATKTDGKFIINKNTTGMTAAAAEAEKTVTYNGLEHKIDVKVTGPTTGYTVKYSLNAAGPFSETHPSRITVADSGTIYFEVSHPNYNTVTGSGKLKINPATVSVAADNKTITYGAAIPAFTATVTGRPGAGATVEYTVDCNYGTGNVGTYDIIVKLGTNPNYTATKTDGKFIINKNTTGMTAAAAEAEKTVTYNGLEHKIDVKVTGPTTGYTVKYSLNAAGPFSETHPSRITVADSGTIYFEVSHPNYNPAKGSGKLKINPATVSIAAKNETITYGAASPAFTATVTGKPGAGATVEYTVDCSYGAGNVGTYPITVVLGSNPNYTITAKPATLTVNKAIAGMDAVASNKTVTYNGSAHKIGVNVVGPITGYTIKYSLNAAGPFSETHPSRITVADSATIYVEVSHPNYSTATASAQVKINKMGITITADNKAIKYGAAIPTFTATVTGKPTAGATVNYTLNCSYTTKSTAGSYPITVVVGSNPNYSITTVNGEVVVSKYKLTVQIANREKVATAKDPVFLGVVVKLTGEGLDGTDRINKIDIVYSRDPGTAPGKYTIRGTIDSDKYEVRFITGTLTIKP